MLFTNNFQITSDRCITMVWILKKKINDDALQSLDRYATENDVQLSHAALSDLLNLEDKNNVVPEVNRDDLVREVAVLSKEIAADSDVEDKAVSELVKSVEEVLNEFAVAEATLEWYISPTSDTLKAFTPSQHTLLPEMQHSVKQKIINDFFGKKKSISIYLPMTAQPC